MLGSIQRIMGFGVSTTHIRDLKKKLELLRTYGALKTHDALAGAFGVSAGTVRWWWTGDSTRSPERIPTSAVENFLDLLRQAIPAPLDDAEIRSLAFGEVQSLEQQLQGGSGGVSKFWKLVEREGCSGRLSLHLVSPDNLDLVTRVRRAPTDGNLRLGQPFCFEVGFEPAPHMLLLQCVQGQVAVAAHETNITPQAGTLNLLPADGAVQPLVEENDIGIHRFIAIGVRRAFPAEIVQAAKIGVVLTDAAIAILGRFLSDIDAARRSIDVAVIEIRS